MASDPSKLLLPGGQELQSVDPNFTWLAENLSRLIASGFNELIKLEGAQLEIMLETPQGGKWKRKQEKLMKEMQAEMAAKEETSEDEAVE